MKLKTIMGLDTMVEQADELAKYFKKYRHCDCNEYGIICEDCLHEVIVDLLVYVDRFVEDHVQAGQLRICLVLGHVEFGFGDLVFTVIIDFDVVLTLW